MATFQTAPRPGTTVKHARTGQRGKVTGDAGYQDNEPIVRVQWDDRPHEDIVYVRMLDRG